MREFADDTVGISVHVLCELYYGVELSDDPTGERAQVERLLGSLELVFPGESFAHVYGGLDAALTRAGRRIATMDLLIATSAIEAGATLITRNLHHFTRVPGLAVQSYELKRGR